MDNSEISAAIKCKLIEDFPIPDPHFGQDKLYLRQIVECTKQPDFYATGRTSLLETSHPINFPLENSRSIQPVIRYYKIKGAGAKTHKGEVIKPTCYPVYNENPHLGFNEEGNFEAKKSPSSPIGGITLERAKKEFFTARKLMELGCPSILPLQVYEYMGDDMRYKSEANDHLSLGAVITGWPSDSYLRADSIFKYYQLPEYERKIIDIWIKNFDLNQDKYPKISLISTLARLYGKTIRKFSEAGFYRYSGAPDNYSYSTESSEVFLIDLDSCLLLKDVSPIRQSLEIMRDAASGISYLLTYLTNPTKTRYFPHDEVVKQNPFRELLRGYYYDVTSKDIDTISKIIIHYYKDLCQRKPSPAQPSEALFMKYKIPSEETREFAIYLSNSFMRPWIRRDEVFSYLMPVCWFLHRKSGMMNYASKILSREELLNNIANYSSPHVSKVVESELNSLSIFI